jgi:multidrug efflux pump subunit AcrA (membrane-fusion protein)
MASCSPNLSCIFLLFGCAALMSSCRQAPKAEHAETAVTIQVGGVSKVEKQVMISASGSVEARETVTLSFQVAGRVARILVEEGMAVKAGQPLAELDARDYEFGVQAASAQAAAAKASLDKAEAGARQQEVAQAKANLDRWEDEYGRMKTLYDRKSLAPADFHKIEAAYIAAKEQYSLAREGARKEDKAAARDLLEQAKAQEGLARKHLTETRLSSPIDGMIVRKDMNPGEVIGSGRPVLIVMALDPVKVRLGVPEAEIDRIRAGQRVAIRIPALGDREFEGRVDMVGYAAEPQSRTFPVKAVVPNPQLLLRAGMVAEAKIETNAKIKTMTVAGEAIARDPQGATFLYVYAPDKKRVYQRRVELGTVYGREIEVTKGLSGDERIVTGGQNRLTEGALVALSAVAQ